MIDTEDGFILARVGCRLSVGRPAHLVSTGILVVRTTSILAGVAVACAVAGRRLWFDLFVCLFVCLRV